MSPAVDILALALVAISINVVASCDSGRIFLGSINETHPLHLDKNGVYVQQSDDHDGYPLYKHQSEELYIYHVSGSFLSASFWVVGAVPGSLAVSLSVQTSARTPDRARETWRMFDSPQWILQPHLQATCVRESFGQCQHGQVHIHGLSPWSSHQGHRTGLYNITNRVHDMRPVYSHNSADGEVDFLYYMNGVWMIGPEVGRVSAALFVLDYAWRPEYIIDDWIVFNGRQFQRDPRLRITCPENDEDESDESREDEPDRFDVDDLLVVEEGMLGGGDDGDLPVCDPSYCMHGGTCITNEQNVVMCACRNGFNGPTCADMVACGDAPTVENGRVVSQTGTRYHDRAFYSCDEGFMLQGSGSSRCRENGSWGSVPSCESWLDIIDPGVIPAHGPNRRQLGRNHRRNHRRHNN